MAVLAFGMSYNIRNFHNKHPFILKSEPQDEFDPNKVVRDGKSLPRYYQNDQSRHNQSKQHKTIKENIKEYRTASLFEDYSDLLKYKSKSQMEQYSINLGNPEEIPNRQIIQLNLADSNNFNSNTTNDDGDLLNNPFIDQEILIDQNKEIEGEDKTTSYFQKILVFRINDKFHATSSFCGYDLTDLSTGVLLGDKLTCPTCLSEYNIESGVAEQGPNSRYLATFPISIRKKDLVIKLPKGNLPLFSKVTHAEQTELDPRHYVIIGDNETAFGCIDAITKVFTGRITIIGNRTGEDFIDFQKLSRSFFPLKAKHSRFLNNEYLLENKIIHYEDKVKSIDADKHIITLHSGQKMPFDKCLISVGSPRAKLFQDYTNIFYLNNIIDHAKIHNNLIRPETTSVVILGSNMRAIEIASSVRRYLDAIGKDSTRVSIVSQHKWCIDAMSNKESSQIIQDYLKRNRILLFKDVKIQIIKDTTGKNVSNLHLIGDKKTFRVPGQMFIYEGGLGGESRCDFIDNIYIPAVEDEIYGKVNKNIILPDERLSLHTYTRYPSVFTAGSCSFTKSSIINGPIRTDNVKTNYHLGFISALNMFEVHFGFDDVVVNSGKILDKWVHFIGNDNLEYDKVITHVNKEKNQMISYLCVGGKVKGFMCYGFRNLHIYLRAVLRMNITPSLDHIEKHLSTTHLKIVEEVLKRTDEISCYRHKALSQCAGISTKNYTMADQSITHDIMKRSLTAYNTYKEHLDKVDKQKKENEMKEKEMQEELRREKNMEMKIEKEKEENDWSRNASAHGFVQAETDNINQNSNYSTGNNPNINRKKPKEWRDVNDI